MMIIQLSVLAALAVGSPAAVDTVSADSVRREYRAVVAVVPQTLTSAGPLVRSNPPGHLYLSRYLEDQSWSFVYLIENALGFDSNAVLSGTGELDSRADEFFQRLEGDSRFNRAVLPMLGRFLEDRGVTTRGFPVAAREEITLDDLVVLATRFYLPDFDPGEQRLFLRICSHSGGLVELPIARNDAIEAWIYGVVRTDAESETNVGANDLALEILRRENAASALPPEFRVHRAQREIWRTMRNHDGLRDLLVRAYGEAGSSAPFVLR